VLDAVAVFAPAIVLLFVIVLLFGPDPPVTYDREYEESPPTDTPPALVPPLLRRSTTPEPNEFTATLMDLVRRGYFAARPVPGGRRSDGPGQDSGDLELRRGDRGVPLREFEVPVAEIFDGLLTDEPAPLSNLRGRIEGDEENVARYVRFRDAVEDEIESRGWYTFTAARVMLFTSVALLAVGMAGTALLYPLITKATFYFGATVFDGAVVLFYASGITKLVRRRRRTAAGQLEAKRWEAFRRYLTDFPRLGESPAASLELWEQHLVYAIAFGRARRVLEGAALYRLEMLSGSPMFWLGLETPATDDTGDVYSKLGAETVPSRGRRTRRALMLDGP
jgi:uncharacterized membrane protein